MSRCELSGKSPVVKNRVSHSNIKTKSRAYPNIQRKRLYSQSLNRLFRFKVATSAICDIEHKGGLDTYILRQPDESLSKRALGLKNRIQRQLSRIRKKQK